MWKMIWQTLKIGDILIVVLTLVVITIWGSHVMQTADKQLAANVFVGQEQVLTIPLSELTTTTQYEVMGVNGPVLIEAQYNQVRVLQERSPKHLCSIQGWAKNTFLPIVCLPNQVVVELVAKGVEQDGGFDSVVR